MTYCLYVFEGFRSCRCAAKADIGLGGLVIQYSPLGDRGEESIRLPERGYEMEFSAAKHYGPPVQRESTTMNIALTHHKALLERSIGSVNRRLRLCIFFH